MLRPQKERTAVGAAVSRWPLSEASHAVNIIPQIPAMSSVGRAKFPGFQGFQPRLYSLSHSHTRNGSEAVVKAAG